MPMVDVQNVVHSRALPAGQSGELIQFTRQSVHWEWMSFSARRLAPGEAWECHHAGEETACVLLSGKCLVNWGTGKEEIGGRTSVFDGLPYALYLAPGERTHFTSVTSCEIAECHVPSQSALPSRVIKPKDVVVSLRGGGNASRQIVDIMPPDFPAERLIVVEVYTPGGNWSSYPPHKHDVHNPPQEADLDEIYYYRMNRPGAFAHQHLYRSDGSRDIVITARDGDAVLVRDGYHPVVAGPGYDVYYLNFIAGSSRAMAITEDPDHVWIKSSWPEMDKRLPLIRPMESKGASS
jgi:5-deoxy-glucuronate isomerase